MEQEVTGERKWESTLKQGNEEITEKEKGKKEKDCLLNHHGLNTPNLWLLKASAHNVSFNHNCFCCLCNKSIHNSMQVEWAHSPDIINGPEFPNPLTVLTPSVYTHTFCNYFPHLLSFYKYFKTNPRLTSRWSSWPPWGLITLPSVLHLPLVSQKLLQIRHFVINEHFSL